MEPLEEKPLEQVLDTLSEKQAVFILVALLAAGHVSRAILDDAIRLSRWVKP